MAGSDAEIRLVKSLQSGDESAFARLYDNYGEMLFGVIVRIVADEAEAENLLQDCFVKIWRHIQQFDPEKGRLATWLINIARNLAIDFTRSKFFSQKRKNQELEKLVHTEMLGGVSAMPVEVLGLRQLVENLTPVFRQVIEWMYFEGYTQQEIADQFNIPLGTVKTRTRLALRELKKYFYEPENMD